MALANTMDRVEFFPAPDKAYECVIWYFPPKDKF